MKPKTINIDVEVVYYWFDLDNGITHKNGDYDKITQAIQDGDYSTFMDYYHKYNYDYKFDNKGGNMTFFPDEAAIFYNDEWVGDMAITSRTGFNMITDFECYVE